MKWHGQPYQQLKQDIFDLLRAQLLEEHARKISLKQVFQAIDHMLDELIKEEKCDG